MINLLSNLTSRHSTPADTDAPLNLDEELAALSSPSDPHESALAAMNSPCPQVRERAIELLGGVVTAEDSEAIAALLQAMSDSSSLVRWRAALLLREVSRDERADLELSDEAAYANWQEQLVDELLTALLDEATARWTAVERLGQLRLAETAPQLLPKVRHYLVAALSDEQAPVRLAAAESLAGVADEQTIAELLTLLRDHDPLKRRSAAAALGHIRATDAVVPLIALLRDSDASVRLSAADALGDIADLRALAPLIVALADDDPWVRVAACAALGKLGDAQAAPSLLHIVEGDESLVVRRAALAAIAGLDCYPLAHPLLLKALHHDDAMMRRIAAEQLARAGNPDDSAALRPLLRDEQVVFGRTVGEVASAALDALGSLALTLTLSPVGRGHLFAIL